MNPRGESKNDNEHIAYNKPSTKKIITDKFCNLLNYISLFLSFVYNIYFFTVLKNDLFAIPEYENQSHNNMNNTNHCGELCLTASYIISWNLISIVKSFVLLFLCRVCFGDENDCNWFCLLVKALSSFIPSVVFSIKLRKYLDYTYIETNPLCEKLRMHTSKFFDWEVYYVIGIITVICLIPAGAFLVGMKEYYKSRRKDY
jgi:hypothetical protein